MAVMYVEPIHMFLLVVAFYIVVINLVGCGAMWLDKRKAEHDEYRISEIALFRIAVLGGSIGTIVGMNKFRHKTKHFYFKYGMPMILALQVIVIMVMTGFCTGHLQFVW